MKQILYILLMPMLLSMGCSSPQRYYARGNYPAAVDKALERVRKQKAKDSDIAALESAFNQLNRADIARMERHLSENTEAKWDKVIQVAEKIQRRQEMIQPYIPMVYPETNRAVVLTLYNTRDLISKARTEAVHYHMQEGHDRLNVARLGDKAAARSAHSHFQQVLTYDPSYQAARQPLAESEKLGMIQVFLRVENQTPILLPAQFRISLENMMQRELDGRWYHLRMDDRPCPECDYEAVVNIGQVLVSPDGLQETRRVEKRMVEDGWQYVLDKQGNVMKDTNGNDIKLPVMKEVIAEIFETRQFKSGRLDGYLEIWQQGQKLIRRAPVAGETQFVSNTVWFRGDERALTEKTKKALKGHPVPYPAAEALLGDATELFVADARNALRREKKHLQ